MFGVLRRAFALNIQRNFQVKSLVRQTIIFLSYTNGHAQTQIPTRSGDGQVGQKLYAGPSLEAEFVRGQRIQAKVVGFGKLGATVEAGDIPTKGLITQREISMYIARRGGGNVLLGDVLDGYVQRITPEGNLDVSLRPLGKERISVNAAWILEILESTPQGVIPVGDKSTAEQISDYFHGLGKTDFKDAIGALYRIGAVKPDDFETKFIPEKDRVKSHRQVVNDKYSQVRAQGMRFTLFLGNLSASVNKEVIENLLRSHLGEEKASKVVAIRGKTPETIEHFAFVDFTDRSLRDESVASLKNVLLHGRKLRVDVEEPKKRDSSIGHSNSIPKREQEEEPVPVSASAPPAVNEVDQWLAPSAPKHFSYSVKDRQAPQPQSRKPLVKSKHIRSFFVGNLSYNTREEDLERFFAKHCGMSSLAQKFVGARVVVDQVTGRKRGFGYVDVDTEGVEGTPDHIVDQIVRQLNDRDLHGRRIRVTPAEQRKW